MAIKYVAKKLLFLVGLFMKIAIDLDQTVFCCESYLYKIINMILPKQDANSKLKYVVVDQNMEDGRNFLGKVVKVLNPDYYQEIDNAIKIIDGWYKAGHQIILLSSRPAFKASKEMVIAWLENSNVSFNMLVMSCNNKAKFCEKYKIDVLIDDKLQTCINAKKFGVYPIYFRRDKSEFNIGDYEIVFSNSWNKIAKTVEKFNKKSMVDLYEEELLT